MLRRVLLMLAMAGWGTVGWGTVPVSAGENWPQFRGPRANGQSAALGLPVTFGEGENVRWKTPVHGKAWSSPVVWDQQIWVTTATQDGKELGAVCVDAESGRIVHDVVVFKIAKPQFCHPMNSYGTPTPVVEKGRVYLHFGTYGTACLDTATAKTLWTQPGFSLRPFPRPGVLAHRGGRFARAHLRRDRRAIPRGARQGQRQDRMEARPQDRL